MLRIWSPRAFRGNDAEQSVGEVNGIIESYKNNATTGIALKIESYISPKQFNNVRENPIYRKGLKILFAISHPCLQCWSGCLKFMRN